MPIEHYSKYIEGQSEVDAKGTPDEISLYLDDFRQFIEKFKQELTPRELEILETRMLSNSKTLKELGSKYKITREGIRQIQQKLFLGMKKEFLKSIGGGKDVTSNLHRGKGHS